MAHSHLGLTLCPNPIFSLCKPPSLQVYTHWIQLNKLLMNIQHFQGFQRVHKIASYFILVSFFLPILPTKIQFFGVCKLCGCQVLTMFLCANLETLIQNIFYRGNREEKKHMQSCHTQVIISTLGLFSGSVLLTKEARKAKSISITTKISRNLFQSWYLLPTVRQKGEYQQNPLHNN